MIRRYDAEIVATPRSLNSTGAASTQSAFADCCDEGKRCAETLFFDYHRQHDTPDIKVTRIFNTYGPRMPPNDGRVVSNFIVQALRGQDIMMISSGAQTRSHRYVDDLVEGLLRMMETETGFTGPINLVNPGELPLPQDDPKHRRPSSTSRARS